jgi:predicted nucleic acid-binding protein
LKRQGTPIPIKDVWIAALVLQHDATLLTRDADFDHLPQVMRA